MEEAGKEVETLLGLDHPPPPVSLAPVKGWYQAAVDRAPPPAQVTLDRITAKQVDLYSYVPLLGANIPISVEPFPLDDSLPMEDKIRWVVKILQITAPGGLLGNGPNT